VKLNIITYTLANSWLSIEMEILTSHNFKL